jgi:subtilase family serine protease
LKSNGAVGIRATSVIAVSFALFLLLAALGWASFSFAQSPPADRVAQTIDDATVSIVRGNIHPLAKPQFDHGTVDASMPLPAVTLTFNLTRSQQADLETLLATQQDRSSPNYHRWLAPEEFGSRFGLSQSDLGKVVSWLERKGFTVLQIAPGRTSLSFSGTAEQVQSVFHIEIHRFVVDGQTHYANVDEPAVPSALAGVIAGFGSLNDFRPKPRGKKASVTAKPNFTSSISGNHFLAPGDFATIYDLNPLYNIAGAPINGAGQTLAIVGQSAINVSDVQAFRSAAGLAANDPVITPVPNLPVPGIVAGDVDEASLDIEWAGAVARNATIFYVYSTNVFAALSYAIQNNVAPVVSISYGNCEQNFSSAEINTLSSEAQQANAEGITIVAASGDSGAADCDTGATVSTQGLAVDLPGSLPYVTAAGGTQFNEGSGAYWLPANGQDVISSAISYIPEIVWNDTAARNSLTATGGGSSTLFAKPAWQAGTGVPDDGARDVPDISFNAAPDHDGYLICSQGNCVNGFRDSQNDLDVYGGTSFGAPTFAGIVALINQTTQTTQGNVNAVLYPLAAHSPASFHDITTGNNEVPFQPNTPDCSASPVSIGYAAATGYDLTTGLGSVDAFNLVTNWTSVSPSSGSATPPDFQLAFGTQAVAVTPGACGTANVTVTPLNNFAGIPAFSCSVPSSLPGVLCAVTPVADTSVGAPRDFTGPGDFMGFVEWPLAVIVFAAMLLLFGASKLPRLSWRINGEQRTLIPGLALVCLLAIVIGCSHTAESSSGGSGSGGNTASNPVGPTYALTVDAPASTAASSGVVTVTASIGGVSRNAQITVTVR